MMVESSPWSRIEFVVVEVQASQTSDVHYFFAGNHDACPLLEPPKVRIIAGRAGERLPGAHGHLRRR